MSYKFYGMLLDRLSQPMEVSMKKRVTTTIASLSAIALFGIAGCGGTNSSNSATTGAASSSTSADAKPAIPAPKVKCDVPAENLSGDKLSTDGAKGEITFQTQGLKGTFDDFFNGAIKQFEADNPDIKVNWTDLPGDKDFDTKMVTQASNCQMADVINVPSSTILALSKRNLLLDLDVKSPGTGDIYSKSVWDSVALGNDNHHTAYPWYFGPFAVTYNKDIFQRAGIDPEKAPATMDEYFEFAKKITAANKDKGSDKDYALYGNTSWYMPQQWRALGAKIMNEDHTKFVFAEEEPVLKWVKTMAEIYKDGGIPKDSLTGDLDMSKAYGEGKLAFGTPNVSFLRNVQKNSPEVYSKTGVGREALNEGVKPLFSGQFIAVSVTSKQSAAALKFANFIAGEEQGLAWAKFGIDSKKAVVFPASTSALKDPALVQPTGDGADVFDQGRVIAAQEAQEAEAFLPAFYLTGEVQKTMIQEVNAAIIGQKDPAEALKSAQEKMNVLLEKINK